MEMPFTVEQFIEVFKNYNTVVFPMQVIFNLLAFAVIYFAAKKRSWSNNFIAASLCALWLWMGTVYHLMFFATINPAAYIFGIFFIFQGIVMYFTALNNSLSFNFQPDIYGLTGSLLILYAMIIYPIIGYFAGHVYPSSPTFGLPCPTTIFTFGLLLWTDKKFPVIVLIIPFLWSVIGFLAAFSLGVYEDMGLLIAGSVASSMILIRNRLIKKRGLYDETATHISNIQV